jgi:hypothetical protein
LGIGDVTVYRWDQEAGGYNELTAEYQEHAKEFPPLILI